MLGSNHRTSFALSFIGFYGDVIDFTRRDGGTSLSGLRPAKNVPTHHRLLGPRRIRALEGQWTMDMLNVS